MDPAQQQNDAMIRDVDDSLRQDQLRKLWGSYGSPLITLVVGIILVTAILSGWESWTQRKNEKYTDALIDARESNNIIKSMTDYSNSHTGSHQMIAQFHLAGEYRQKNQMEEARQIYKTLSENRNIEPLYRDLGTLLYASTSTEDSTKEVLETLSKKAESPWQSHAGLEWALFLASQGNYTEALEALERVTALDTTPTGIRQKAESLMVLYKLKGDAS